MAYQAHQRWKRASREVAYVVCQHCARRLEVTIDNNGDAVTRLYYAYLLHSYKHTNAFGVSARDFKSTVKVDRIYFDEEVCLDDIISPEQLSARARGSDKRGACIVIKRIRELLQEQQKEHGKYACLRCGLPITRSRARRFKGIGVKCGKTAITPPRQVHGESEQGAARALHALGRA